MSEPTAWPTLALGELTAPGRPITYGVVKPGPSPPDGVLFVRGQDIVDGRIRRGQLATISSAVSNEYRRTLLRGREVLIVLVGTPGMSAVVPPELAGANISRATALVACGPELLPEYLSYWLRSPDGQGGLRALCYGSVQQVINLRDLAKLRVPVPPGGEQQRIAEILGALDDKIESNRRLCSTAEELIRVELSFAQDGDWPEVPVSSLGQFVNGGAYTNGATGNGRMVIRIAELRNGPGGSTVYNDLDVPDEKLARPGDLLMSWSGSLGVFRWARPEAIINQHIFKVICGRYPAWLVYLKLGEAMPEFQQIAADKATTMGHIKRHHLDDAKVQVPPDEALRNLDEALSPLWQRVVFAEVEALSIEALRDALLPELLSGRLRVADAGQVAEAVK